MNTNRFEFKVANGLDRPAIWFPLHGKEVLIFPLELYHSLWGWNSDNCYISPGIHARLSIFRDEVFGRFQDDSCGAYEVEFQRSHFVDSAISSLQDLCNAVVGDVQTAYKDDFKIYTAKQMLDGLNALIRQESTCEEKAIERFTFNFVEPYACDTHFVITIGDRKYESNLSDWTTNFNRIRLDLERSLLTYLKESKVELFFEDSPTIISLRNYSDNNKNLTTSVTIIPNEFVGGPNLFGDCDPRQLISSLYLGLLGICITETDWFDNQPYGGKWDEFRLATYNKLQSCLIENFIKGFKEGDFSFFPRQRVIESVERMKEDYINLQNTLSL